MCFDQLSKRTAVAIFLIVSVFALEGFRVQAQSLNACSRGPLGGEVPEPPELRSTNGELKAELAFRSSVDSLGLTRYCYVDKAGNQSATLRVKPGDRLTLILRNELPAS